MSKLYQFLMSQQLDKGNVERGKVEKRKLQRSYSEQSARESQSGLTRKDSYEKKRLSWRFSSGRRKNSQKDVRLNHFTNLVHPNIHDYNVIFTALDKRVYVVINKDNFC